MFRDIQFDQQIILATLLLLNFGAFIHYCRVVPWRTFWYMPFSIYTLFYMLNYPIRAIMLVFFVVLQGRFYVRDFTLDDMIKALAFATAFFILFIFTSAHLIKRNKHNFPRTFDLCDIESTRLKLITNILFIVVSLSYLYLYKTQNFYNWDPYKAPQTLVQSIAIQFSILIYVGIFAALLVVKKIGDKRYYIHFFIYIAILMVHALLSTSKAIILIILVIYLFYKNLFEEKVSKGMAVFIFGLVILSFFYSYDVRSYGLHLERTDVKALGNNLYIIQRRTQSAEDIPWESTLNRFSLLDDLIYTMLRTDYIDKGYFTFGTIVEVANVIPRFIWPGRPFLSFSHFAHTNIYGKTFMASVPIGIIGESFFVYGWFGFLVGWIQAWLYFIIFERLFLRKRTLFYFALYINLYFCYLIHDTYMFRSFNIIVFGGILIYLIFQILPTFISGSLQQNKKLMNNCRVSL